MKVEAGRKVALVTGAGSGIGKATAIALAKEGYAVGLLGDDLEDVIPVADEPKTLGLVAATLKADISVEDRKCSRKPGRQHPPSGTGYQWTAWLTTR